MTTKYSTLVAVSIFAVILACGLVVYSGQQHVEFGPVKKLYIGDGIDFIITKGDESTLKVIGNINDLDDVILTQTSEQLSVNTKDGRGQTHIEITIPDIEFLRAGGLSVGVLEGFTLDSIDVRLTGGSFLLFHSSSKQSSWELTGQSSALLERGAGVGMNVHLSGGTRFDARSYRVELAEVHTSGSAQATINAAKASLLSSGMGGVCLNEDALITSGESVCSKVGQ